MGTLSRISIAVTGCILTACQASPTIQTISTKRLSEQALEQLESEAQATLIAKREFEQATFVVLKTPQKSQSKPQTLKFGWASVPVVTSNMGERLYGSPDYSLYSHDIDPQKKALVTGYTEITTQRSDSRDTSTQGDGYILALIQDPALLRDAHSVKFIFNDQTRFETVPLAGEQVLIYIYRYDQSKDECCSQVDFLAEDGKVLHSRANGIQIFP